MSGLVVNPHRSCLSDCRCESHVLPTNLVATITDESDCSCVGSVDVDLIWDGQTSFASDFKRFGNCGTNRKIRLLLPCGIGSLCGDFPLDIEFSDGCTGSAQIPAPELGCNCQPLMLVFISDSIVNCCGGGGGSQKIKITICEP